VVQAGTLGEHRFTEVRYSRRTSAYPGKIGGSAADDLEVGTNVVSANGNRLQVELPPGTEIRMEIGLERAVNDASYRGPWD
jgi:hypothetical protein